MYFPGETYSTIQFCEVSETHHVTIRCHLKNYVDDIEKFIGWITPYISAVDGQFIGYKLHEKDQLPDLIVHPATVLMGAVGELPGWLRWLTRLPSMFDGTVFEK